MSRVWIWLLTRTAFARALALFIASSLVGFGIIGEQQQEAIVGALVTVIVGFCSIWIEVRKAEAVKDIQADHGAKVDGYAGPKTRSILSGKKPGT